MTWDEVLEAAKQKRYLYYKAPLDYRPTLVSLSWNVNHPRMVRVIPPVTKGPNGADPFWADESHLLRFSLTR